MVSEFLRRHHNSSRKLINAGIDDLTPLILLIAFLAIIACGIGARILLDACSTINTAAICPTPEDPEGAIAQT